MCSIIILYVPYANKLNQQQVNNSCYNHTFNYNIIANNKNIIALIIVKIKIRIKIMVVVIKATMYYNYCFYRLPLLPSINNNNTNNNNNIIIVIENTKFCMNQV